VSARMTGLKGGPIAAGFLAGGEAMAGMWFFSGEGRIDREGMGWARCDDKFDLGARPALV